MEIGMTFQLESYKRVTQRVYRSPTIAVSLRVD